MIPEPRIENAPLRTKYGLFTIHIFSWSDNEQDNILALTSGLSSSKRPLIRIQSACYTGEIFGSLDCDCHWQLETRLTAIQREGGAFIYMLPDLDSRTGFRHREWQKCWRLIKPGQKCGAKL
jgi:GTP cyclohydrolase II